MIIPIIFIICNDYHVRISIFDVLIVSGSHVVFIRIRRRSNKLR
ncbi:hypothetical protein [Shewanella donghaensis]|nr:hypothetical protein [Shewanella donghaensis]